MSVTVWPITYNSKITKSTLVCQGRHVPHDYATVCRYYCWVVWRSLDL